ncbi:UDP-N-acetylmuramate--L-alanine ligase [Methylophilaceae bacterium]|nr:UDP-N-acetylmuramate--L-alanine ligase [Methylophilaceae bacterium]
MKNKIKNIHFVGIGGSGMSGIAEVMHNLGFSVTGSDSGKSIIIDHLKQVGINIYPSHMEKNIIGIDVLVVSSAIKDTNPEIKSAKDNKIPIIPRAEMLSELMRFKRGIAIAGTHGKTTTTSLTAAILSKGNLDPTYVIGGRLNVINMNAKLGSGELFIVEADESDASFLHLNPIDAVITNIDRDHLETYQGDFERLKKTYIDFVHQTPFYGTVFLCLDDPEVKSIIPLIARPIITYGTGNDAQIQAKNITHHEEKMSFTVIDKYFKKTEFKVTINFPGLHYVNNSLAAIAIGLDNGVTIKNIQLALLNFQGVSRRYDIYKNIKFGKKEIILIDDYGHHPTEIKAVIEATKKGFPNKEISLVFQPHRYSRTRDCYADFIETLKVPEKLFLFDIYSAGEQPLENISSSKIIKDIGKEQTFYLQGFEDAKEIISTNISCNSILIIMGAGSIGHFAKELIG